MARFENSGSAQSGSHFENGQAGAAEGAGQHAAQSGGAGGQDPGDFFATMPVATPTVSPEPVKVGGRAGRGGSHFKQQGGTGAAGTGRETGARAYAASGHRAPEPEPDEKPASRRRGILSGVLIGLGVILLVVAAVVLGQALMGYYEAGTVYDDLEEYAVVDEDGDGFPSVDFEALAAINSDIVGWIYIPGTQINYPVVQTTDNTTYLTKLFDDTSNTCGTIFMDYEGTAPGMVDMQTTLYGHHMNDGSMFKFIDNTLDQDEFDSVKVVYYITADAVYVLKPLCTTEVDEDYIDARTANFSSEAVLRAYVRTMVSEASAVADDADERVDECEQVLTLVTCAGEVLPRTTRACMLCTIEEVISTE